MSYFSQQKKGLNEKIRHSSSVGPGSYSPQKIISHNQSYAPFGSLIKKNHIVKNSKKQPLGPGAYNINRQLIKPSVIQYENQNCIIIKINEEGGSQFKSKQPRFANELKTNTPGPGSYNYSIDNKYGRSKRTKSVGSAVNKMKELYEQEYSNNRKPTLASDQPIAPDQEYKKKQIPKGVLRWDLNKKQRFHTEPKQFFNEQDKSILIDKANYQKKKQLRQKKESSFFASKSIKSSFDQLIYKSSNPFKVQIRKMLGFQDQQPGPGSYNTLSKEIDRKPIKFQFFGSTVERFQNREGKQPIVGPGDYQVNASNSSKTFHKTKKTLKQKQRPVLTEPSETESLGPGCYYIQNNYQKKLSFNRKYNNGQAQFGSRIPRFHSHSEKKKQEKTQYISFMAQEDEERKKRIEEQFNARRDALKNKNSSVFISETKRGYHPPEDNNFGMYQTGVQNIQSRVKKQKQFFQQFAQCNLTKPGFLSSVQRFKHQRQEQPTHHKDCWCQIKEVEKKNIEHMSASFQSNSKRIEVFDAKNKGPAVGSYSKQSSFIRESFNSRFIKQNKNKTKKIKIWKQKQK